MTIFLLLLCFDQIFSALSSSLFSRALIINISIINISVRKRWKRFHLAKKSKLQILNNVLLMNYPVKKLYNPSRCCAVADVWAWICRWVTAPVRRWVRTVTRAALLETAWQEDMLNISTCPVAHCLTARLRPTLRPALCLWVFLCFSHHLIKMKDNIIMNMDNCQCHTYRARLISWSQEWRNLLVLIREHQLRPSRMLAWGSICVRGCWVRIDPLP